MSAPCSPAAPRSRCAPRTRCRPRTTWPRRLVDRYGAEVYAINGEDNDTYYRHIHAVVDRGPQITMDDGADVVGVLHGERSEQLSERARRHRGDDHRRHPPPGARAPGQARLSDHRRQRRQDQALLRQPLRHRAVDPRRSDPGHQRPDRRPARGRDRLRLVRARGRDARQGPRGARDRLRGRPAARAGGADGRLRGDARRRGGEGGRRVHLRDRQPRRDRRRDVRGR